MLTSARQFPSVAGAHTVPTFQLRAVATMRRVTVTGRAPGTMCPMTADAPRPAQLSDADFAAQVLNLREGQCAAPECPQSACVAHHILVPALWVDGGNYIGNGVPLCQEHHERAQSTMLTPEQLRSWAGHRSAHLPEHLEPSLRYDTWGNVTHEDDSRSPGELFFTAPAQQALKTGGVLAAFDRRVRYPRTFHLPDSPGRSNDDRVIKSLTDLDGTELVTTEKLDGGNVTWMRTACFARSLDSADHPSRHYVKSLWASRAQDIPVGWRISGEDLFARRSVAYDTLPGYFVVFGVWDETNTLLSWDETVEWAQLLDLPTVPLLYRGTSLAAARAAWAGQRQADSSEGFVIRTAGPIPASQFSSRVAKWVRASHVRTSDDFRSRDDFEVNGLART